MLTAEGGREGEKINLLQTRGESRERKREREQRERKRGEGL